MLPNNALHLHSVSVTKLAFGKFVAVSRAQVSLDVRRQ